MDFHHVFGEKTMAIGGGESTSASRIRDEIAKCVVLCANCHRIRTHCKTNRNAA